MDGPNRRVSLHTLEKAARENCVKDPPREVKKFPTTFVSQLVDPPHILGYVDICHSDFPHFVLSSKSSIRLHQESFSHAEKPPTEPLLRPAVWPRWFHLSCLRRWMRRERVKRTPLVRNVTFKEEMLCIATVKTTR